MDYKIYIFCYHGITEKETTDSRVWVDDFKKDLIFLKEKDFDFWSLYDVINKDKKLKKNTAVITFDDGLSSQFRFVFPIIEEMGIVGTFFIPTKFIGTSGYLSKEEIKKLAENHFIESHGYSHQKVSALSDSELYFELKKSAQDIADMTGRKAQFFAYPFGNTVKNIEKVLIELGYVGARTTIKKVINANDCIDRWMLPAFEISSHNRIHQVINQEVIDREYWDKIYAGELQEQRGEKVTGIRPRFVKVLQLIKETDKRILDVGAGYAELVKVIKAWFPDKDVYALDFSEKAKVASGFDPYIVADVSDMPFNDKFFDLVVCCNAIEYFPSAYNFLREAKRVGKRLIITTATRKNLKLYHYFTKEEFDKLLAGFGEVELVEEDKNIEVLLGVVRF